MSTKPVAPPQPEAFAPWFVAATHSNPKFNFSTLAGRYVLLGFLPQDPDGRARAMQAFATHRGLFDDVQLTAFMVVGDPEVFAQAREEEPGLRWFFDSDGAVSRLYGALD